MNNACISTINHTIIFNDLNVQKLKEFPHYLFIVSKRWLWRSHYFASSSVLHGPLQLMSALNVVHEFNRVFVDF